MKKKMKWDDAYIPAGGINSNISDMMQYINKQMLGDIPYLSKGQQVITEIDATTNQYTKMNIRMDAIGIVILSNCSPNYRIPTTVMGVKLMMMLQDEANIYFDGTLSTKDFY